MASHCKGCTFGGFSIGPGHGFLRFTVACCFRASENANYCFTGFENQGSNGFLQLNGLNRKVTPRLKNQGLTSPICPTDGSKNGGDSVTFAGALIGFQWYFKRVCWKKNHIWETTHTYIYIYTCVCVCMCRADIYIEN